jgi:hypothetical protein
MPEPTYSLPVTIIGIKMRGSFFPDEIPGALRPLLMFEWGRWTSEDGEGRTISIWPPLHPDIERHRQTIARTTHGFYEDELLDTSMEGRENMLRKLERILAHEHQFKVSGAWFYDAPRHFAIKKCYDVEMSLFLGPTRPLPD